MSAWRRTPSLHVLRGLAGAGTGPTPARQQRQAEASLARGRSQDRAPRAAVRPGAGGGPPFRQSCPRPAAAGKRQTRGRRSRHSEGGVPLRVGGAPAASWGFAASGKRAENCRESRKRSALICRVWGKNTMGNARELGRLLRRIWTKLISVRNAISAAAILSGFDAHNCLPLLIRWGGEVGYLFSWM